MKVMKYIKHQLLIVLGGVVCPFKVFGSLSSRSVNPFPLVMLGSAMWLEAGSRRWFYQTFQRLHSMPMAQLVVMFQVCVAFAVAAVLVVVIIKAIGGRMTFIRSVNVLGLAQLPYSLYLLLLCGVLQATPVNTLNAFIRNNPETFRFWCFYVYWAIVVYSGVLLLCGAIISGEQGRNESEAKNELNPTNEPAAGDSI
jgi:hypothetical protein